MQRAKVGMIGLAAVLLLIGLAAAIFATVSRDRQVSAIGSARPDVVATMVSGNSTDSAKEPLAELGVAPSAVAPASNQSDTLPPKAAAASVR
ncbi:hypothetical protein [Sphingomonas echinoides]|uniref:Flp pilus assembly protein CpaB n=1 Tax=Sphingomonas echinoides TaxID=59803 RepID=A0ABU4PIL1_9SPHN|nr:hypothetical protein [Sphingomonas echinoides]MDX5984013.1 hypothetical protein [Sphingomonas echinoides]